MYWPYSEHLSDRRGSARKPAFPRPIFSSTTRKFLEQTGESFIPWHTKLPSLSCGKARVFFDPHISITIPTPPTRIPNLTTLHPTLAIDFFPSRLLGPLSK